MLEEVQSIHDSGITWERLEKLGLEYRFCSEFLQGKIASKEELFEGLFIAIRQFAKRQETWFRMMEKKGVEIHWLQPGSKEERIEGKPRVCRALVCTCLHLTEKIAGGKPAIFKRTFSFFIILCINSHFYSFSNFCKVTCADAAVKEFL